MITPLIYHIIVPICYILFSIIYLKVAHRYKIYDVPVSRSSHRNQTVTGFGLFVLFGLLIFTICYTRSLNSFFIIGLVMICTISYLDDIVFVKHFIRLIFQLFALTLMTIDLPFEFMEFEKWPIIIACVIFGTGVLNAFNFMDGINGMLGLNSLVILLSFWYLNFNLTDLEGNQIQFANPLFLYTIVVGVLVFLYFNLRPTAKVFAGDVGSIGLAFVIFYFMANLVFKTGNYTYLLLFVVLGIDAGLTIIYKLIVRENIFVPHRDFLFKKLVHVGKVKHLKVASIYALLQLAISVFVIALPTHVKLSTQLSILFITVVTLCALYINVRNKYTKQRIVRIRDSE